MRRDRLAINHFDQSIHIAYLECKATALSEKKVIRKTKSGLVASESINLLTVVTAIEDVIVKSAYLLC